MIVHSILPFSRTFAKILRPLHKNVYDIGGFHGTSHAPHPVARPAPHPHDVHRGARGPDGRPLLVRKDPVAESLQRLRHRPGLDAGPDQPTAVPRAEEQRTEDSRSRRRVAGSDRLFIRHVPGASRGARERPCACEHECESLRRLLHGPHDAREHPSPSEGRRGRGLPGGVRPPSRHAPR